MVEDEEEFEEDEFFEFGSSGCAPGWVQGGGQKNFSKPSGLALFPKPSCWGCRGPPTRLRRLTLGLRIPEGRKKRRPPSTKEGSKTIMPDLFVRDSVECNAFNVNGSFLPKPVYRSVSSGKSARGHTAPQLLAPGNKLPRLPALAKATESASSFGTAATAPGVCGSSGASKASQLSTEASRTVGGAFSKAKGALLKDLARVVREELGRCATAREVAKAVRVAELLVSSGPDEAFNTGGRLMYRLREITKSIGGSRLFEETSKRHAFQRLVQREASRRREEILTRREETAQPRAEEDALDSDRERVRSPPSDTAGTSPREIIKSSKTKEFGRARSFLTTHTSSFTDIDVHESIAKDDDSPKSPPANVSTNQWKGVFDKCSVDGEVHRDDFCDALNLCVGLTNPIPDLALKAFDMTSSYASVKFDEFQLMAESYVKLRDELYTTSFKRIDEDNSGEVEIAELIPLLEQFKILPLPYVLKDVLKECDADGTGCLSMDEFVSLINKLRARECFTKGEYEEMADLFHKYDRDGSGEMDSVELISILALLGFTVPRETAVSIEAEVDFNGSGSLNLSEYMTFMRKVKELEIEKIKTFIERADEDGSGTLNFEEISSVLRDLGVAHVDAKAIVECGEILDFDVEDHEFDLNDLWELIALYRKRDGFVESELQEIEEAFQRYDKYNEGEMSVLELGKLLRYLGYTINVQIQKQLIGMVDVDGSGRIDPAELKKLIRLYQARDVAAARDAFLAADEEERGEITFREAEPLLSELDCIGALKYLVDKDWISSHPSLKASLSRTAEPACMGDTPVDLHAFIAAFAESRRNARAVFRSNGGFSNQEVESMRITFKSYDSDGSGDIGKKELVPLIEDVFPTIATDPKMRPKLRQMMEEVDQDGSGTLDFQDFLSLMIQLTELMTREQMEKERKAISETNFSSREVEEFRDLFVTSSEGRNSLGFKEVKQMLGTVCPMGDKNATEFLRILQEVVAGRAASDGLPNQELSFPEFLTLMYRVLVNDFANISEKVKSFV